MSATPHAVEPGAESGADGPAAIVTRYLEALVAHDWAGVSSCLAEGIVRVGPWGDAYTPRDRYLEFLSGLMPRLPGYSMRVDRVVASGSGAGAVVVAELSETVSVDGSALETPEALIFDLDEAGRIAHISIYLRQQGAPVPELAR